MRKPIIDVFAICYNEEALLPYFIDHYKNKIGARKITIYDNQSTDSSKEIILAKGCEYIEYDSDNQIRDDIYLNIKNNCWKETNADWVIVCDIDEFLFIDGIFLENKDIIYSQGYDMLGEPKENLGGESFMGRLNWMYSKTIMFRPNVITEINYNFGCHVCRPTAKRLPIGNFQKAILCHFNRISEEYTFKRLLMCQERLSDFNKNLGLGTQYMDVRWEEVVRQFEELRTHRQMVFFKR